MRKGEETRERILDIAEVSVLQKGFGATSIEEIIAEADITKSGFFYHFKDKNALARELLNRYVAQDDALLDEIFARGRELSDDPLHAFLIGLKLFAETVADLPNGHPGCLVATYCYQERLFDREIREINRQAVLGWRRRFAQAFEAIAEKYEPRADVDVDALADMVSTIAEGGIVLSKALGEPEILAQQILLFRSYVSLLFQPSDAARAVA